ncbi:MAG: diacylglycerol kinase family protein [Anaerolineales bacterium]|uniref:Diacylglycerol kinase family protein n=1 Tax=Candidatus Desulfolinea nitratireducens TaxID=2841698 RepID=A0A8J6TJ01_9CHLR|nr:diacylglycerol kinase family protein [Candidatus Desulfolinea nitratireducens]MBL6961700.1 diacylglycerol kinase family protein [Anaerolineales bacterium]
MKDFIKSRLHSFGHAFNGWSYVLRTQPNTWIHATITALVLILAFWLQLSLQDWAVLLLTIMVVWAAEFFNTAIESMVDLASPGEHPLAKISKDAGAAAVLITALISILIGLLILGPPLLGKINSF